MRAEEIRVLRHHFRFEPDSELHSQVIDLRDEFRKAALDFLFIYHPVPEAGIVVVPLAEPAVVHDDHLDAHIPRGFRDLNELFIIKIEESGFPSIDEDRTLYVLYELAAVQVIPEEVVIIMAHLRETFVRVGHEDRGRIKILARTDHIAEQSVIDSHHKTRLVILVELDLGDKASGIHQGEAVAGTVLFICGPVDQRDERVLLVGRNAAAASDLMHVMRQRLALDLALLTVPSRQRDEIQIPSVHIIHIDGHDPLQADLPFAAVVNSCGAHDDIRLLEHRIEECHLDLRDRILNDELQRIDGVIFRRDCRRQSVQRERTFVHFMGAVSSVK